MPAPPAPSAQRSGDGDDVAGGAAVHVHNMYAMVELKGAELSVWLPQRGSEQQAPSGSAFEAASGGDQPPPLLSLGTVREMCVLEPHTTPGVVGRKVVGGGETQEIGMKCLCLLLASTPLPQLLLLLLTAGAEFGGRRVWRTWCRGW
eukprot:290905-Chlamydomonas_euryale.AAC.1